MMKNKLKKIIDLITIFLKDSHQSLNIINTETHKLNKKSVFLWMMVILVLALLFVSDKIIEFLVSAEQPEIFLNIYFLVLAIVMMFQTILVCTNIFYFSKDLEFVLPLPITPIELLISKYGTLLSKLYISEILFGIIPMFIYGIRTDSSILFYIFLIIVFILFPIFLSLVVSIVMMFVMKVLKFIRNKDIFQVIMTLLLMLSLLVIEYKVIGSIIIENNEIKIVEQEEALEEIVKFNNRIKETNEYFVVVNPSVDILSNPGINSLLQILKLICINFITFVIFLFIGKKTYLKDILRNTNYLFNKKNKIMNIQKKSRPKTKNSAYINKEFKTLFRNPMFFMQCVYPIITSLITIIILSISIIPQIEIALANEEFRNSLGDLSFDLTAVYLILGLIQFLFMMSPTSLTGISREGRNAVFMKYIPISFYKQFTYKGIPQIFINTISIVVILGIIYYAVSSISFGYIVAVFVLAMLLNIINSYIMLLVDLIRPKLNWDTEYDVLKQNNNKIFQYVFTVLIIVLLIYMGDVLENVNLDIAIIITGVVFSVIIIVTKLFVWKKQDKLFKKIG